MIAVWTQKPQVSVVVSYSIEGDFREGYSLYVLFKNMSDRA